MFSLRKKKFFLNNRYTRPNIRFGNQIFGIFGFQTEHYLKKILKTVNAS